MKQSPAPGAIVVIYCTNSKAALNQLWCSPVHRYLNGRVFVLNLLRGSQAEVDRFVQLGDIIDEINGISLRNANNGQVREREKDGGGERERKRERYPSAPLHTSAFCYVLKRF